MIVAGGASLRRHWNAGRALSAIQSGRWDHVVLQEQSTLPVKNRVRFHDNVRLFDAAIRAVGARTVLYLTWARASALQSQHAITSAVQDIASELGVAIVPVGIAWQRAQQLHPQIALYLPDGSHPTAAGAFLAACVFCAALCGVNPVGRPAPPTLGLDDAAARLLQSIAAETVWRAGQEPTRLAGAVSQ